MYKKFTNNNLCNTEIIFFYFAGIYGFKAVFKVLGNNK